MTFLLKINNLPLLLLRLKTKLNNTKRPTLKKGIKAAKTGIQNAKYVIIKYESVSPAIMNVHNIIVYNVPVTWMVQHLLQYLSVWEKTISVSESAKRCRKYSTV